MRKGFFACWIVPATGTVSRARMPIASAMRARPFARCRGFRSWIPIRMRGKSTRTPGRANCIFRSAGLVRTSHRENARYLNAQRFHARLVSLLHVSSNARGNLTLTVNSSDLVSGRRAPKVTIPAQSASLVAVWQRDCSLDCTTFKK
jgi:hypothetical protein